MTPTDNLYRFYRSSPMREGVLCWYPFESDASVLDLSGGVLTELLNSRCGKVTANDMDGDRHFDYIVVLDPENYSVETLNCFHERLNSRGRLLLAYENPFALRYWSGKCSPRTGRPYDSLQGRDERVSKAEMQIRLNQSGFAGQKWYYPLTDHWFATEIYSESYLPDEYLNQRFVPYISNDGFFQFDERQLYREMIRGGAFEFMCGAYLIEARVSDEIKPCPVDYAAITAYRDPAKRFATTVHNDGIVWKMPLHPDGHERVERILHNHEELARMGVNVIPVRLDSGALAMPRIESPTLWDYWVKKLTNGTLDYDEMRLQFDSIRDSIYKASANGGCYWELVPANCFYEIQTGKLMFFDQEYVYNNKSPEYALVRALGSLKYSSAFSADSRSDDWLKNLIKHYCLNDCWRELFTAVGEQTYQEVFGSGMSPLLYETEKSEQIISEVWRRKHDNHHK